MSFWDEYGFYINVCVAVFTAIFVAVVLLQIIYIQSKLNNAGTMVSQAPPARIPFGIFAVYVDDIATSQVNSKKRILPAVSVTYYDTDESANSFPITISYVPTNSYSLVFKPTSSAESLKLMIKNNNANYIVIAKSLYGVTMVNDNIVLYTPIRTGANDILQIVSFTGISTTTSFDRLKTLSPAAPVHVLAYKV
jgi:hypothetical protein